MLLPSDISILMSQLDGIALDRTGDVGRRWYITSANPPPPVASPFDDRGGRPPALFQEHRARELLPLSSPGSRRTLLPATSYPIYQPAAPAVGVGGPRFTLQIVSLLLSYLQLISSNILLAGFFETTPTAPRFQFARHEAFAPPLLKRRRFTPSAAHALLLLKTTPSGLLPPAVPCSANCSFGSMPSASQRYLCHDEFDIDLGPTPTHPALSVHRPTPLLARDVTRLGCEGPFASQAFAAAQDDSSVVPCS
ncbi:hypothetical protein HWV62_38546 [Athelia sp. TMB]|nr:hypothetical protein HWV62_38546 [Athelia sp. TMB]